jgi:serine phosphatase RsbU (regulator of sigma subunit)
MIHVGIGQAEGSDTLETLKRAIAACRHQMNGFQPQAGIVLTGSNFDHRLILREIHRQFPQIELIGGTTAGNFSSTAGFSDDAISLMGFYSDCIQIRAGLGRRLSSGYAAAAREAVAMARDGLESEPKICLALPDLIEHRAGAVVKALDHELGRDCVLFGGCPAIVGEPGEIIHQFCGDEILQGALPLLLFAGPIRHAFFVANSWKTIGPRVIVSGTSGRLVRYIGSRKALAFYHHYLGEHASPATEFPLAVYGPDGNQTTLRGPIRYHPQDGSITFADNIPEGATVQLTEAIRDFLIDDIANSAQALKQTDFAFSPAAALAFSCTLRKDVLGTRVAEEIQMLEKQCRSGLPILGFYGYGEIAPPAPGLPCTVHNATLITLVIGEEKGTIHQHRPQSVSPTSLASAAPVTHEMVASPQDLQRENAFLRMKLKRSEGYRKRLEEIKELNAGLHRKIIHEIETARRQIQQREREHVKALQLAGEVQINLLPHGERHFNGLEVAGKNVPGDQIGGDYFDYLQADEVCTGCMGFVVGDISGHGVDAALLMTSARGFLRTRARQPGSLADIITDMNRYLSSDVLDSGRFMTLFYLAIDPRQRLLRWIRAGHEPAMLYSPAADRFLELKGEGIALGIDRDTRYREHRMVGLSAGEVLAIGTDGIWEAHNRDGVMFGKPRLQQILRRHHGESPQLIIDSVFDEIDRFTGGKAPEDDMTLVIIKSSELQAVKHIIQPNVGAKL